jgi:two-component system, NarL family, sensor kinase
MAPKSEQLILLIILGTLLILLLSVTIIAAIVRYNRRQQLNLLEKNQLQSQFQQTLLQTQLEIQEQTLKTISEEIHDNIGQILSLAKLNLNTLPNSDEPKIQDTKNLVSKAITDLRNLSHSMHGDIIAELGLQQSIVKELRIIESTKAFTTELKVTGAVYKLNAQKEMVLFRMVQEALHNIVKHSSAANIIVTMQYVPTVFTLTIADNGKGFDLRLLNEQGNGLGIHSMHNRAKIIGASFNMSSTLGNGTVITIQLPLTTTN